MPNLFAVQKPPEGHEQCDMLAQGPQVRIERIVSCGHASPPGFWYDQSMDEWVCLLQGEARLKWESGPVERLIPGDWIFIPAHARHRIEATSLNPPCVWLAVHACMVDAAVQ